MKTEKQNSVSNKHRMSSSICMCIFGFIIFLFFASPEKAVQAQELAPAPRMAPAPAPAPASKYLPPPAMIAPEELKSIAPAPAPLPAPGIPAPAVPAPEPVVQKRIGLIQIALPFKVEINKPFNIEVWFEPSDDKFSERVEVFMDETDGTVKYKPNNLILKPNAHQTVEACVVKSNSGLARVIVYGDFKRLEPRYVTIDAGFSAKLQAKNLDRAIESGTPRSIILDFTDSEGKTISLEAPVKLSLQSANTLFKQSDGSWTNKIEFDMKQGQTSSPAIEIKPKSWTMDVGMIMAGAGIDYDHVVLNQNIPFTISPPWWLSLLMAVMGGILHGTYQTTRAINEGSGPLTNRILKEGFPRIAGGALAGLISYFFIDWNIIGIKIDTTSLKGFVILGFLFSYVGIDLILKHILPKK